MIKILTSAIHHKISGGTIFNTKLFDYLKNNDDNVTIEIIKALKNYTFEEKTSYIIDGILIEKKLKIDHLQKFSLSFLIHLWPSLNLGIPVENRIEFLEIEKQICQNFKVFVTGNNSMDHIVNTLKSDSPNHFLLLPGIDANWKKKTTFPELPKKIIYVSNFIEGKGYFKLLEIAKNLNHINFQIDCYGEILSEKYHAEFLKTIENLELENVNYKGCIAHESINDLLIEYDLLFHFSEYESFGMSVLEAMASNIPSVITPTGNYLAYKNQRIKGVLDTFDVNQIAVSVEKILTSKTVYKNHIQSLKNFETMSWEDTFKTISEKLIT